MRSDKATGSHEIRAVFFDYGGTLDCAGTAWKEHFLPIYKRHGVAVEQERFDHAFYRADDSLVAEGRPDLTLTEVVEEQVRRVLKNLHLYDKDLALSIAGDFITSSINSINASLPVLRRLRQRYRLGIISNNYGNLLAICKQTGLDTVMDVMVDSRVVGAEKPDERIFHAALDALDIRPEQAIMVGDSLKRDIKGALSTGMGAVWIVPSAKLAEAMKQRPSEEVAIITSIDEIADLIWKGQGQDGEQNRQHGPAVPCDRSRKIRAGLIAAGTGSRFRKAGIDTPKPMVEVGGRPLLGWALSQFRQAGIDRLTIIFNTANCSQCSRYMAASFPDMQADIECMDTESSFASFLNVLHRGAGHHMLITTTDSIYRPGALSDLLSFASTLPEQTMILGISAFIDDEKPLYAAVDQAGRITALHDTPERFVTTGVYLIPPEAYELGRGRNFPALRKFLGFLIENGVECRGFDMGKSVDVDRPGDIAEAERLIARLD